MTPPTVLDFLAMLLDQWNKTYLSVRQDGKLQYLSLNEISDQKVVAKFVADRLKQYRQLLQEAALVQAEEAGNEQ